jgi:outer membrane receptor protein involved in Fe transport
MRQRRAHVVLALVVGFLAHTSAWAQDPDPPTQARGNIRVSVVSRNGGAIAGVVVQVLGVSRQIVREASTDESGVAALSDLHPGRYEVRALSGIYTDVYRVVDLRDADLHIAIVMYPAGVEERVTVTASRAAAEEERKIPATVRSLDEVQLRARAVDLLPRMLDEEPGILTQQTTPGQGSPILRGQSAQAVLYLVDGVRYNNATYRAGNTQYLAWVPDIGVESVETLLGPAGVNYGSDALGGAINVLTKPTPAFANKGEARLSGSVRAFGESASLGGGLHATAGGSTGGFAAFVAGSATRHGEVRGGGGRDSHHAAVRFLGFTDAQVRAAFGSRAVDTGYGQQGLVAKASVRVDATSSLDGFLMASSQQDVQRYDRQLGGDGRVLAAFTPQRLTFGYVRYERFFADTFVEAKVSLNTQTDGRIDQNRPTSSIRTEYNSDTVWGVEASGSKSMERHLVTGGAEIYLDSVDATRDELADGITEAVRARVPNGATYRSLGVFLLDEWRASERLRLSGGLRFSAFEYRARASDNIIDGVAVVPDTDASFTDLTFNLGGNYTLSERWSVWGRLARGFRAPSIFDFGEIGLTGGGFEVTPDEAIGIGAQVGDSAGTSAKSTGEAWSPLAAETVWSYEAGVRYFRRQTRLEVTGFLSNFGDNISRRTLMVSNNVVGQEIGGQTIVAQDDDGRIYVAGETSPVVSRVNASMLRVWGIEAVAQQAFGDRWLATVKASLQRGNELDTGFYARKISPDNLTAILRWRSGDGRLSIEGVAKGAATQRRLNPGDLEDARIGAFRDAGTITDFFVNQGPRLGLVEDGILVATGETLDQVIARVLGPGAVGAPLFTSTPGWVTVGIRGTYVLAANQTVTFALNNFTDLNYRLHGSGIDGLGINATLAYDLQF